MMMSDTRDNDSKHWEILSYRREWRSFCQGGGEGKGVSALVLFEIMAFSDNFVVIKLNLFHDSILTHIPFCIMFILYPMFSFPSMFTVA